MSFVKHNDTTNVSQVNVNGRKMDSQHLWIITDDTVMIIVEQCLIQCSAADHPTYDEC